MPPSRFLQYSTFNPASATDIHLMDPWLDSDDMNEVLEWLKYSFLTHCSSSSSSSQHTFLFLPSLLTRNRLTHPL